MQQPDTNIKQRGEEEIEMFDNCFGSNREKNYITIAKYLQN